jgi:hypothetical protein
VLENCGLKPNKIVASTWMRGERKNKKVLKV